MTLLVVGLAVAGWIVLDAALVAVLVLMGHRRERQVRALAASLVAAAERYTEAAAPAGTAVAGQRAVRGPTG